MLLLIHTSLSLLKKSPDYIDLHDVLIDSFLPLDGVIPGLYDLNPENLAAIGIPVVR